MVILGTTKLTDALKEHPNLKDFIISLSPKFKKLDNTFIFNTVKKWVNFNDIAKIGGFSSCEILHKVNQFLGTEKELYQQAPDCLKSRKEPIIEQEHEPNWLKYAKQIIAVDVRDRNDFFLKLILDEINKLKFSQVLKITNNFYPAPLVEMLKDDGYELFYKKESSSEHLLFINFKEKEKGWHKDKENFIEMDVRGWKEDPFSEIMKKVNSLEDGQGLKLIQVFVPEPLINMIEPMGFETHIDKINPFEHHIYFYKIPKETTKTKKHFGKKIPLVIQSATPVVYPILMRILQSRRLMDKIKIEELKVWDKTEKHLGWIVNGKADISFSAIAAIIKLYQKGFDVKLKSVNIWDNFFIMTRDYQAKKFEDLYGHKIEMPLIPSAPPYSITSFLIKKLGLDLDKFEFSFGDPFGRPQEIKEQLLSGEIDTALLREPEASFAIYESRGVVKDSIPFKNIWKMLFPGTGNLPNAGLVIKGELLREHPELVDIFMEETELATKWVLENKKESAKIAYDIMGITPDEAEFFLNRVSFLHRPVKTVIEEIKHYVSVLNQAGYTDKTFEDLKDLFI